MNSEHNYEVYFATTKSKATTIWSGVKAWFTHKMNTIYRFTLCMLKHGEVPLKRKEKPIIYYRRTNTAQKY